MQQYFTSAADLSISSCELGASATSEPQKWHSAMRQPSIKPGQRLQITINGSFGSSGGGLILPSSIKPFNISAIFGFWRSALRNA